MMDVGTVSASQWQTQSEGQQSGAVPRRPSGPSAGHPDSPDMGAPSDYCALVSSVPHTTAQMGEMISLIQSTLSWIDKAILCLQEVASTRTTERMDRPPHDAVPLAMAIAPFTAALEHVLTYLGSCHANIGPELRIGLAEELLEKEGLVTLQQVLSAWQDTPVAILDPRVAQDQATLDACREHMETWLNQLADIATRSLEGEEKAMGIDLSFISKVNAHQLENELSAWLVAVAPTLARAHSPVQPSRAAVLLQFPPQ